LEKTGIVIKTENKKALVQVIRTGSCGENCAMCKGGCNPTRQRVWVNNEADATVGETVSIELSDRYILAVAFFGWRGGAAGLVSYFLLLKNLDKKLAKRYTANITKVWGQKH
jgi:sigma-E factor negative regulatory protein RseC